MAACLSILDSRYLILDSRSHPDSTLAERIKNHQSRIRNHEWAPSLDLRLFEHARHDPPFPRAERPRFGDVHPVADLRLVPLVVREEPGGHPLALPVELVAHLALDGDDHRLLHLVADDPACQFCLRAHVVSM